MLELKNINAGYGSFQALFDVSLSIKAGEAIAVIGPNGAGKTTLMRVISGLIRPLKGAITMEGTDVVATQAHRILELGIAHVPQKRRHIRPPDGGGQPAHGLGHLSRRHSDSPRVV